MEITVAGDAAAPAAVLARADERADAVVLARDIRVRLREVQRLFKKHALWQFEAGRGVDAGVQCAA